MKKITALVLALLLVVAAPLALASCSKDQTYTVGICQLIQHTALDAATQGFKDALIEALGEENITFIEQNAQGDSNTCTTIITDFTTKNVDLILANATAALQAAANGTTTIPILGTSITDYVTALDLENFNGTVGGNISGTSDLAPLDKQAAMLQELFPAASNPNVGLLYCSAEPNSKYQIDVIKPILEGMGYTCTAFPFADTNELTSVATAAAAASDVIYVPTDNTVANATETVAGAVGSTPIIAGEEGICKGCGVATLSIDYYELGKITGQMAAKILKGEEKIENMAIQYAPATTKKYMASRATGLTIPADYVAISEE